MFDSDLHTRGWVRVHGIDSKEAMVELAKSIGNPINSPSGKLVKELRPQETKDARENTLSSKYGTGNFPLHTDTAFWPVPARYLVFRVHGDVRRPTIVRPFEDVLDRGGSKLSSLIERSVWIVRTPFVQFYASFLFRIEDTWGYRYDKQCMSPANAAAKEVEEIIQGLVLAKEGDAIDWSEGGAVIVSNWSALHGRGIQPNREKNRILERIYIQ